MVKKEEAIRFLEFTRRAGIVKRFHTVETHVVDRVASHTFGVLNLVYILSNREPSNELFKAALFHDDAECLLGDIPTNIKMNNPTLADVIKQLEYDAMDDFGMIYPLTKEEDIILKIADILEGMYFVTEEIERGNRQLLCAFNVYSTKLLGIMKNLVLDKKSGMPLIDDIVFTLLSRINEIIKVNHA